MPSAEKIHELLAKCDRARDGAIQSARRIVKRGLAQSLEAPPTTPFPPPVAVLPR